MRTKLTAITIIASLLCSCGGVGKYNGFPGFHQDFWPVKVLVEHPAYLAAMQEIEEAAGCRFFEEVYSIQADIIVATTHDDCTKGIAKWTPRDGRIVWAECYIPQDECEWKGADMVYIAIHELMHAIGVGHNEDPESVMHPRFGTQILPEDIIPVSDYYCGIND